MSTKSQPRLGAQLVESMRQAVAIKEGRLRPSRRHRLTLREARVSAPPRYCSSRIRRLRERLGLSQPVFAQVLNVSVATIRGWEQGARIPDGPSRRLLEVAELHSATILTTVSRARSRSGPEAAA